MQSHSPAVGDGAGSSTGLAVPAVTIAEQIACIDREIGMRGRVYPRWVKSGKLNQAAADLEIKRMEAVRASLLRVQSELPEREPGKLQTGELFGPAAVRDRERQKVLGVVLNLTSQDLVYRVVAKLQEADRA